jgi:Ni/Fe-hydrogenase subunit HybB-like protein
MLSVLAARPLWGGGLTLVSFLTTGAVAALAAGVLAWKELAPKLGMWLGLALGANLVLVLAEVLTLLMSPEPRVAEEMSALLTGRVSPLFWAHVVGGLLLPLALLLWTRGAGRLPVVAILALLGVIVHKLWVLVLGQTVPWLTLPQGSYWPTWSEIVGLIGAAALVAALYMVVRSLTRLEER